jgi:hypothetical protein
MKIREGHVSNSSSSSFVIALRKMPMIHQTPYGTVVRNGNAPIQDELADLSLEIVEAVKQRSPLEVLTRTFKVKLKMLECSGPYERGMQFPLSLAEELLLEDSISAMRGAVEALALRTDEQQKKTESEYLALLTTLVANLLGGKKTMSQQQISDVENTVKDLVSARKAFTAFNVTKELRAKGQQVFHRDLRNVVHGIYRQQQMDDYQQTQVQPSGFPRPAILYYPPEVDPNEFTGDVFTAKVQPTSQPTATPDDDDDDDGSDDDSDDADGVTRSINNDGVLFVPRWMGRDLNARQRGAHVMISGASFAIEIHIGKGSSPSDNVHVDPRNNIRLSRSMLVKLGADWPSYKISKKPDMVVITKG